MGSNLFQATDTVWPRQVTWLLCASVNPAGKLGNKSKTLLKNRCSIRVELSWVNKLPQTLIDTTVKLRWVNGVTKEEWAMWERSSWQCWVLEKSDLSPSSQVEIRSSRNGRKTGLCWKSETEKDGGAWSRCCIRSGFKLSNVWEKKKKGGHLFLMVKV